jgi:hypothetical protein
MTKTQLLGKLGNDSSFLDFDLFPEPKPPGEYGGKSYDRAYMGFDFVGYCASRETYLLVNSWKAEEERLFEVPKGAPSAPHPVEPSFAA